MFVDGVDHPYRYLNYILGTRYSDGCIYESEGKRRFWLGVTAYEYAAAVAETFRILGVRVSVTKSTTKHGSVRRYVVNVKETTNKSVNNTIIEILDQPWETNRKIIEHCRSCITMFCRGFGDGDGGYVSNGTDIEYSNKDFKLLLYLQKLLKKMDITTTGPAITSYESLTFHIRITRTSVPTFYREIGFTISKKQKVLEKLALRYADSNSKSARVIVAANLVRLGFVSSQTKASKLLSVSQSAVSSYLRNKRKWTKLLTLPEVEELSKKFMTDTDKQAIIDELRKMLIL